MWGQHRLFPASAEATEEESQREEVSILTLEFNGIQSTMTERHGNRRSVRQLVTLYPQLEAERGVDCCSADFLLFIQDRSLAGGRLP